MSESKDDMKMMTNVEEDGSINGSSSDDDLSISVDSKDSSKKSNNTTPTNNFATNNPIAKHLRKQDPGVQKLRILAFVTLMGAGICVSLIVFNNATSAQTNEFVVSKFRKARLPI